MASTQKRTRACAATAHRCHSATAAALLFSCTCILIELCGIPPPPPKTRLPVDKSPQASSLLEAVIVTNCKSSLSTPHPRASVPPACVCSRSHAVVPPLLLLHVRISRATHSPRRSPLLSQLAARARVYIFAGHSPIILSFFPTLFAPPPLPLSIPHLLDTDGGVGGSSSRHRYVNYLPVKYLRQ